jgi:hypothetical protein
MNGPGPKGSRGKGIERRVRPPSGMVSMGYDSDVETFSVMIVDEYG